jgi:hypothetical protein
MRNSDCVFKEGGKATRLPLLRFRWMSESWLGLAACLLSLFGAHVVRAQIVQPPEPVDPSPINGETYFPLQLCRIPAPSMPGRRSGPSGM